MSRLSDDEIRNQEHILSTYRRTLAHHLRQRAIHGTAYAPPSVIHGIEEARIHIRRIKQILREQGIAVDDHPDDEELPSTKLYSQTPPRIHPQLVSSDVSTTNTSPRFTEQLHHRQSTTGWRIWKEHPFVIGALLIGVFVVLIAFITGNQSLQDMVKRVQAMLSSSNRPTYIHDPQLSSVKSSILFECYSGLCSTHIENAIVQTVVETLGSDKHFRGFSYSTDGTKLAYGITSTSNPEKVEIYLANADGSKPLLLFELKSLQQINMETKLLGFGKDSNQVIFEENSQVFTSNIDGSARKPVTPILPYGASSTHYFYVSPEGTSIMMVGTGLAYHVELYNINGPTERFELNPQLAVIGFGRDRNHALVVRVKPSYQINPQVNQAAQDRSVIGLEEIDLRSGTSQVLLSTEDNASISTMIRSNVSNGKTVFGSGDGAYFIDLVAGKVLRFNRFVLRKEFAQSHGYHVAFFLQ